MTRVTYIFRCPSLYNNLLWLNFDTDDYSQVGISTKPDCVSESRVASVTVTSRLLADAVTV